MNDEITQLRKYVDNVDETICSYLEMRQDLVEEIQDIKKEEGISKKDTDRESRITSNLKSKYPEIGDVIEILYSYLFNRSTE